VYRPCQKLRGREDLLGRRLPQAANTPPIVNVDVCLEDLAHAPGARLQIANDAKESRGVLLDFLSSPHGYRPVSVLIKQVRLSWTC